MWVASGFGGHGLNTTAMGGELIARGIVEADPTWRLFAPYELVWAGGLLGRVLAQGIYWGTRPIERLEQGWSRYRERARSASRRGLPPATGRVPVGGRSRLSRAPALTAPSAAKPAAPVLSAGRAVVRFRAMSPPTPRLFRPCRRRAGARRLRQHRRSNLFGSPRRRAKDRAGGGFHGGPRRGASTAAIPRVERNGSDLPILERKRARSNGSTTRSSPASSPPCARPGSMRSPAARTRSRSTIRRRW